MAYTKTTWVNGQAPAISADNLNNIETGIENNDIAVTGLQTGWNNPSETWEYVSVDDPTGVIKIQADVTGKYSLGMRLKFTNGGNVIFGIITKVGTYGGDAAGYTYITFLHEIDPTDALAIYLMQNSAITLNYFSVVKTPYGFPVDVNSWTRYNIMSSSSQQLSPTQNVWYNLGGSLAIPIGSWRVRWEAGGRAAKASTTSVASAITLSTANNSESDTHFTAYRTAEGSSGYQTTDDTLGREKPLSLTSKTTYYLNIKTYTSGASDIWIRGETVPAIIRATCAYL